MVKDHSSGILPHHLSEIALVVFHCVPYAPVKQKNIIPSPTASMKDKCIKISPTNINHTNLYQLMNCKINKTKAITSWSLLFFLLMLASTCLIIKFKQRRESISPIQKCFSKMFTYWYYLLQLKPMSYEYPTFSVCSVHAIRFGIDYINFLWTSSIMDDKYLYYWNWNKVHVTNVVMRNWNSCQWVGIVW